MNLSKSINLKQVLKALFVTFFLYFSLPASSNQSNDFENFERKKSHFSCNNEDTKKFLQFLKNFNRTALNIQRESRQEKSSDFESYSTFEDSPNKGTRHLSKPENNHTSHQKHHNIIHNHFYEDVTKMEKNLNNSDYYSSNKNSKSNARRNDSTRTPKNFPAYVRKRLVHFGEIVDESCLGKNYKNALTLHEKIQQYFKYWAR